MFAPETPMKSWPWSLFFFSMPLLGGCGSQTERRPTPSIDGTQPAVMETATFALG